MKRSKSLTKFTTLFILLSLAFSLSGQTNSTPFIIANGWQLQDASKISQSGKEITKAGFQTTGWYNATVPGTILTTLVNNGIYPEPLWGENNRPDKIPETLCRTSYWYRTTFLVPADYKGKKIWLNFDGINYFAMVFVNGKEVGNIKGAFIRGLFDISSLVTPGEQAVLAVLISPQPNPGIPHEHTIALGMGGNGGITASDGPTFLCSLGWDWIPAIRDRNTGIWQKVFLSASGAVLIKSPLITTDLPLPKLNTADISVQTTLENVTDQPQKGILKGSFGNVSFQQSVEVPAHTSKLISLTSKKFPQLLVKNPKLWWPNGYGPQNLYTLSLSFDIANQVSDSKKVSFGIRKITYSVPETENLTISVNGVKVLCKGGNWGMDEAMKRIPRERLEAQIRMHQIANYTMIRNWVGQSTSEDFYDMCDKYGILLWDEFFQANPGDGPNPNDQKLYLANVRDKILRFRNHPSIAVWCARNEGFPPKEIDDSLKAMMSKLEPMRHYQSSSTEGRGVNSGGPYFWRKPSDYYVFGESFKTEIGSMSIPTLESVHGMMPEKDWEIINDDWAEHDFARGAQRGNKYPDELNSRYGKADNLADFVRKGQMMNYEAFRAMYEGRNAKLFNPCSGVITWMSNPAQPSFVWQIYHHDLEPNSSLFATKKACELVHIQLNEREAIIQVINNKGTDLQNLKAQLTLYNLDGKVAYQQAFTVNAKASSATDLDTVKWPSNLTSVFFVKLELKDAKGLLISDNFYWKASHEQPDNLSDLNKLPVVTLESKVVRQNINGKCLLEVTLHNASSQIALMAHLQLRRQHSNERVLPVYYTDNYVSLIPNEVKTIIIEASLVDLHNETPMIVVDGWNISVKSFTSKDVELKLNTESQVSHWPITGLPMYKPAK
ncbi:MAG: glycoside hydrolase family 2 [Bacteroidetes bacterium]|nr:glycoside hydrolase family 2 [Bacteroidota bacterium]